MANENEPGFQRQVIVLERSQRLDIALLADLQRDFPLLSRARLKSWFKEGRVFVNDRSAEPALEILRGSHLVFLRGLRGAELAATPTARPAPVSFQLDVIYEDDRLLALNKPSGTPSVPQSPEELQTAVSAALAHFPPLAAIGRGGLEPGILHRLDTGTSGVLLFAKTDEAFVQLQAAWKTPVVRKFYRALVRQMPGGENHEGCPPLEPGLIDSPLAHDAKSAKRMRGLRPSTPKSAIRGSPLPARTRILSLTPLGQNGQVEVALEIETGVMHQIRCHLAELGWPILGDLIYRGLPSPRLWLHAERIEIAFPEEPVIAIEAELPIGWPSRS